MPTQCSPSTAGGKVPGDFARFLPQTLFVSSWDKLYEPGPLAAENITIYALFGYIFYMEAGWVGAGGERVSPFQFVEEKSEHRKKKFGSLIEIRTGFGCGKTTTGR